MQVLQIPRYIGQLAYTPGGLVTYFSEIFLDYTITMQYQILLAIFFPAVRTVIEWVSKGVQAIWYGGQAKGMNDKNEKTRARSDPDQTNLHNPK